jgi:hypothetical protein
MNDDCLMQAFQCVSLEKLEAAKASKEAATASVAVAAAPTPVAAPPAAVTSAKTAKGASSAKATSKPEKVVSTKGLVSPQKAPSSSSLSGKAMSKSPVNIPGSSKGSSSSGGSRSGEVFPAEGPGHKHPVDLEGHLKAALMKFVPKNAEGICVARHAGGMEGVKVKEVKYEVKAAKGVVVTEPLKDASCCAACSRHPACEFWVRETTGSSCWLMKDFSGLLVDSTRRSAFSGAWAAKKRHQLGLGKAPLPGTPGIGEIMPHSMQAGGGGGGGNGAAGAAGSRHIEVDLVPGEGPRNSGGSHSSSSHSSSTSSSHSSSSKAAKGKSKGPSSIMGSVLKAIKGKGVTAGVHKESRKKGKEK